MNSSMKRRGACRLPGYQDTKTIWRRPRRSANSVWETTAGVRSSSGSQLRNAESPSSSTQQCPGGTVRVFPDESVTCTGFSIRALRFMSRFQHVSADRSGEGEVEGRVSAALASSAGPLADSDELVERRRLSTKSVNNLVDINAGERLGTDHEPLAAACVNFVHCGACRMKSLP
ncbi:MAG: hypothetical protein ACXWCE_13655 [Caldimonas sp.]